MGFQFNGTQANVTISGNLATSIPIPSATQTLIAKRIVLNGASQTAYTVTAAKTFYLMGASIVGAGGSLAVRLHDDATYVAQLGTAAGEGSKSVIFSFPVATYTANQNVKVTGSNTFEGYIWGIEQ